MFSLAGMLCRLCKCVSRGSSGTEPAAENGDDARAPDEPDDLTAIRGLGKASQDRLQAAGIKTYAQLAEASPEALRDSLGKAGQGAKVEDWIAQAKALGGGA